MLKTFLYISGDLTFPFTVYSQNHIGFLIKSHFLNPASVLAGFTLNVY